MRVGHSNSMLTRRAGIIHFGPLLMQGSGGGRIGGIVHGGEIHAPLRTSQ
jgi:hypothetical protein